MCGLSADHSVSLRDAASPGLRGVSYPFNTPRQDQLRARAEVRPLGLESRAGGRYSAARLEGSKPWMARPGMEGRAPPALIAAPPLPRLAETVKDDQIGLSTSPRTGLASVPPNAGTEVCMRGLYWLTAITLVAAAVTT